MASKRRNLDPSETPTLTVEQVAELLGTGRTATYDAIRRGEIGPVIKVGRKIVVPTAVVRRLLQLDAL